jgi:hypothetical protein
LLASFKVACRTAICKKTHYTAESFGLPSATDTVETMHGESYAKELQKIPLAYNTGKKNV